MVSATYFTIKNIPILTVLYRKKQNVKFHFAVDLRMQPPITHTLAAGFADKIIFFEKLSVQNNISGFLWLF